MYAKANTSGAKSGKKYKRSQTRQTWVREFSRELVLFERSKVRSVQYGYG